MTNLVSTTTGPGDFGIEALTPAAVRANVAEVVRYAAIGYPPQHVTFWSAIVSVQSPDLAGDIGEPRVTFLGDAARGTYTSALNDLTGQFASPEDRRYSRSDLSKMTPLAIAGLADLRQTLPETGELFELIIQRVLFAKRSGYAGGSVSSRIGLIWLAPTAKWTVVDYAENLLHEFIHSALFLDDMVNRIFVAGGDRLEAPDALALSAIRQTRRGYDKAFHSAVVGHCLAVFHDRRGDASRARSSLPPLLVCLDDLTRKRRFLTSHGELILGQTIEAVLSSWSHQSRGQADRSGAVEAPIALRR